VSAAPVQVGRIVETLAAVASMMGDVLDGKLRSFGDIRQLRDQVVRLKDSLMVAARFYSSHVATSPAKPSEIRYPEPVLCYVGHGVAYFTTRDLAHQWGDDWNDAPYEHNAGSPYPFDESDGAKGIEPWTLVTVAFSCPLGTPASGHCNSPYSVDRINERRVPWLGPRPDGGPVVHIFAGVTVAEFRKLVAEAGGTTGEPEAYA
jgi:hypothetical protein